MTTDTVDDASVVNVLEYGVSGPSEWTTVDWSLHRRSAIVDEHKVNYVDLGLPSNPAVVLIHGLSGNWQNWLENLLPLADQFRVIALDLPGFGKSEMPREPISIPLYARTVATVCEQLGIDEVHVIGSSMGGQSGVRLALDYPELVRRLILVSPVGYSTSIHSIPDFVIDAASPSFHLSEHVQMQIARRPGLRKLFLAIVASYPDKLRVEIAYELLAGAGRPGFAPAAKSIFAHDYRRELGDIRVPTLIVWGQNDRLIGVGDAHRYARAISGSKKLIAHDTGHLAMLERPSWFNRIATDFFNDLL